jgi:hypothetical protein
MSHSVLPDNQDGLLSAFRTHYWEFEQTVHETMLGSTDPTVLARLHQENPKNS